MTDSFAILSTAVLKMCFAHQFQCMSFFKLITLNLAMGSKSPSLYMYLVASRKFTKNSNFNLYVVYGFD